MAIRYKLGAVPVSVLCLFLASFVFGPFAQLHYFAMMPGDIGDARLNNYFLENIYQFLAGRSASLWHLSFFSPFPYVLGFSDNLFGASPVYLVARILTGQADTAFQIWYLFGYCANFVAAYYALKRLGTSSFAAGVGAVIFAFALPVTAHSGHAQLHYRFGVPLSIAMFILFLDKRNWQYFIATAFWVVWQFYCTIYIGFFTLMTICAIILVYLVHCIWSKSVSCRSVVTDYILHWYALSWQTKIGYISFLLFLIGLLLLLFYPYWQVTELYGVRRSFEEIASMLPRFQSYLLSDSSWLWSSLSKGLVNIPMRHEHQMFIGLVPLLLALVGILWGSRRKNGEAFSLLVGSLFALILLTLNVGGITLWFLFADLPLVSAIRAMTRIDQVFLFTIGYLAAVGIDEIFKHSNKMIIILLIMVIVPSLIFESSATRAHVSEKNKWRERIIAQEVSLPSHLHGSPIIFFAQSDRRSYAAELDAMWVSLRHNIPTLNGYSGIFPPVFSMEFGRDCSELPKRILSYLHFSGQDNDLSAYVNLMQRVVPVNFEGCKQEWKKKPPLITIADSEYSPEEINKLSLEYIGRTQLNNQWVVTLKIFNAGERAIASTSFLGKPIRLSWRFLDMSGTPKSGWDTRKDLPFDVPANGSLDIRIPIASGIELSRGFLQVSLVQDGVFWAHDHGFVPLRIPWD